MLHLHHVSIPNILTPTTFEYTGGICMIQGPSGVGKTTLLKCISNLIPCEGSVLFYSQSAKEYGLSEWRSDLLYIPQRPPILPGTPFEFWKSITQFASQKLKSSHSDPIVIANEWNIDEHIWHQSWNELSGGEIQRVILAIGLSRDPKILLLDECTSALDQHTTFLVEKTLKQKNAIWISHDPLQCERMAHSLLTLRSDGFDYMIC